ncbi:MAG: citrate transporter, partial [Ignavibacteria bacterium CG_4_9_14_3_um_filter_36_18]
METVQIILLILVFVLLAALMFFRKIPALLALPIMAFSIPIVAGVSVNNTVQLVLGMGSTRLFEAYTIAIFGSMLSILLQKTGVAESFIKIGAELSGDKPWIIAFIMLVLISLLFTTLGGLGAIIMVATVVLPIMASVGVGPLTTVGVFLFGLSMGGILNVG